MLGDFFGKRIERKPAEPLYDKDGWRPHPDKPGWHIDRQGRLRGPTDTQAAPAVPRPKDEPYVTKHPF
jgi:hypothetical protein